MAGNAQKYKVNILAKDLNMKGKEIVDLLKEHGIEGKTSSASLEDEELSLVFETLTKAHEIDDIGAYLEKKPEPAVTPAPFVASKPQTDRATAHAAEHSAEQDVQPPKPAESSAGSAPTPTTTEGSGEIAQKAAAAPEAAPDAPVNRPDALRPTPAPVQSRPSSAMANSGPAQPAPQQPFQFRPNTNKLRPNAGGTPPQPATPFRPNTNTRPAGAAPVNPNGERRPFVPNGQRPGGFGAPNAFPPKRELNDRQIDRQLSKLQRDTAQQLKSVPGKAERFEPFLDKRDRNTSYGNLQFTKDGFVSASPAPAAPASRPSYNKFSKNSSRSPSGPRDEDESQSVRQPSVRPIFDKEGRARSRYASTTKPGQVAPVAEKALNPDGTVRLTDIRGEEVDLSKYDERLDNLVPDGIKIEPSTPAVKAKKTRPDPKASKGAGGRVNRNEAAAREMVNSAPFGKNKKGMRSYRAPQPETKKFTGPITLPDEIMISDLAAKLRITTGEVIKKLLAMGLGMDAVGANKVVDYDTAYLLADEMGIAAEKEVVVTIEEKLFDETEDSADKLEPRSPVVVVMGHVDHGKTSLLDAIRNTNVTAGEAGGITQHIGAYRVKVNGRDITFLDTPGHEAFTSMRARGAQVTDIAILVVAADDGIMPQTIEAINHAKAAGVSIIIAINKMDKPGANAEAVKQNLTTYELVPEEWGGDTICVPVSALTRKGIDELLEMVLLVADMKELKANPDRAAKGTVIEAKLDKGRGPVATVLVQNGTLHAGDTVIAGTTVGRVRAMNDDKGSPVKTAGPSVPVEIIGLSEVPDAGDELRAVEDERMAKTLVDQRKARQKEDAFKANTKVSLDALFDQISEGAKELAIIVKADVQGSAEAVKNSLEKLSNDEIHVKVIHSGVGGVNEGDVMLADASNAIIVGFNVRPDKGAMDSAERRNVDIRTYRVIYDCIEEITAAINGMLAPEYKEVVLGHAQVRQTIHVPGVGFIAGSYVQDGKITRSSQIRVVRDGVVIFEDKIGSLRRFKDDVKEVAQGFECGIGLDRFNDIHDNDILEAFIMEEIKREI